MGREVITRSAQETAALGRALALQAGDVLFLEGELGAGKTTMVRGIAEACGVQGTVRSPTFALMHRYRGRPDLIHIDLFRETRAAGLQELDLEADTADAITVVEWPRDLAGGLWPGASRVLIEHVDETTRKVTLP